MSTIGVGTPVCMPDDSYPMYEPLCGRQPPTILRGRDWAGVTCPDCLSLRHFVIEEPP